MAGNLVQQGATVMCTHGGQAQMSVPNSRVTINGSATATVSNPWTISGCPGVTSASIPPCTTAQWSTGTTRVTSGGQPLVLSTGMATCLPNGVPAQVTVTQQKVTAT